MIALLAMAAGIGAWADGVRTDVLSRKTSTTSTMKNNT